MKKLAILVAKLILCAALTLLIFGLGVGYGIHFGVDYTLQFLQNSNLSPGCKSELGLKNNTTEA